MIVFEDKDGRPMFKLGDEDKEPQPVKPKAEEEKEVKDGIDI